MKSHIVLGCVAAVVSSAAQSIGLILQRKSYLSPSSESSSSWYNTNRQLWHLGLFLFLSANIFGSSIQITSLPLILLSPLQSIGLVFNTLFHSILLDEEFTDYSLYGSILIALGAVLTAYTGGYLVEPDHNLSQFLQFARGSLFRSWVFSNVAIVSILSAWILLINSQLNRNFITLSLHNNQFLIARWLTALFSLSPQELQKLKGCLYGSISGILSAYSLLMAKSSIDILIDTFSNKNWTSLLNFSAFSIVLIFVSLGLSQLFLLNKGLQNISTSILYPLVFFIFNLTSISNSLIFYQQLDQITIFLFLSLLVGSLSIISGVFLLSKNKCQDQPIKLPTSPASVAPSPTDSHYVSFNSLRDLNPSDDDSVDNDNFLQPIIGKIKKQSSTSDLMPSSYKSSISFSIKNLSNSLNNSYNHNHNHNHSYTNNHSHNQSLNYNSSQWKDDDYNPNNTFNYSANNTLEEIQNQMAAYTDEPKSPIRLPKRQDLDTKKYHDHLKKVSELQANTKHKRVLSYEQSLLLNELRK
ncbi:uncharacterized protein C5L36_0C04380 [Pichia kudriavzevii]|uniref:Putative magnesium transporter NIPA2 n=2 Tax=Pichia kudriavzevii TaxID=4909 RepID=A0A1V2LQN8_PICKU|nr:uncharacterized protein C5L36_0C04380 [Pichia kudriavzevii]AWU76505.1 hypothetical protein C5L36_0C04380 [Pichia kudriavzevii]ONH75586.1 putative magnesium transporter NIPA2 [Pichia kudriavzevii]